MLERQEKERSIEVTYKFLLPEHERNLLILQRAEEMLFSLWDIKMICREHWKNGKFKDLDEFNDAILECVNRLKLDEMYE